MLAPRRDLYQEGLVLSAQSRHGEAIERFERALAERPDDSRVLFALGNTAAALGLPRPAEDFYRRVLAAEPDRIEALVNLANLLRASGQLEAAQGLLEPALARHVNIAELWLTLGSVYREMGNRPRAIAHYRAALEWKPDCSPALGNLADLIADEGNVEQALALYDRAISRDPKNAQARLNRAVLHLLRGALKEGWRDYAARLKIPGKAPVCDHGLRDWHGASLKRTRLLVTAEQGVGDQIMFASMIPELARRAQAEGGSIYLECEPRLAPLFARSFPNVTVKASQMETKSGVTTAHYPWLKAAGGANAAIEMGSLPRSMRAVLTRFPRPHAYLVARSEETARWRAALAEAGPRPHTGICWRSGKTGGLRALQYAPLQAWADFVRMIPGTIVSAQYDATTEEIATLSSLSGRPIFVPPALDQKNELDGTCAMLSALDHVVSAPTAVSWLAAGVRVSTFKILYDTSWTSFGESYEPFAPSCVCVMPKRRGDWADVFGQTAAFISR